MRRPLTVAQVLSSFAAGPSGAEAGGTTVSGAIESARLSGAVARHAGRKADEQLRGRAEPPGRGTRFAEGREGGAGPEERNSTRNRTHGQADRRSDHGRDPAHPLPPPRPGPGG